MNESVLVDLINDIFIKMKVDTSNKHSAPLFKKVIKNNTPIWTAVNETPSICFYLSDSKYKQERYIDIVTSTVVIYIYHKHTKSGLSLDDILSPLVDRVRGAVKELTSLHSDVIQANIVSSAKDGGSILPYTVAELILEVESRQVSPC